MQTAIFHKLIGQILRYALTALAAYLAFVGVDSETYGEAVAVTVNIVTPIIIALAVQCWSFLQKRTQEYLFRYALAAPAGTTETEVKELVAARTPPVVES